MSFCILGSTIQFVYTHEIWKLNERENDSETMKKNNNNNKPNSGKEWKAMKSATQKYISFVFVEYSTHVCVRARYQNLIKWSAFANGIRRINIFGLLHAIFISFHFHFIVKDSSISSTSSNNSNSNIIINNSNR